MDFRSYQHAAIKTLQPHAPGTDPVTVPLLGLVGEAGSVATTYKKRQRDGAGFLQGKQHLREELGDVLWYIAAVAHRLDLDLEDIAAANLEKVKDRWRPSGPERARFDDDYPPGEQLPRQATFIFTPRTRDDGRTVVALTRDGDRVGDPLTDASHVDDDYGYHDAFHLAHVAVLGWSPVMRSLLRCKRKSRPDIDEAEDGGRAIAIEEGISALVFSYASRHGFLQEVRHVDQELLKTINQMSSHLEVSVHRHADWEKAIMTGYAVWAQLRTQGGGTVQLDMEEQTLTVL
ncbi:MazG nucleotide pyrophosphohydrolase domain-containing protein [Streptomyces aculeolatus]